jgi:hypothetical protein
MIDCWLTYWVLVLVFWKNNIPCTFSTTLARIYYASFYTKKNTFWSDELLCFLFFVNLVSQILIICNLCSLLQVKFPCSLLFYLRCYWFLVSSLRQRNLVFPSFFFCSLIPKIQGIWFIIAAGRVGWLKFCQSVSITVAYIKASKTSSWLLSFSCCGWHCYTVHGKCTSHIGIGICQGRNRAQFAIRMHFMGLSDSSVWYQPLLKNDFMS